MKLERIYTIPLGKAYEAPQQKRVPKAVKLVRAFIVRHMKAKEMKIILSMALNNHLWMRSIKKPPRRVKVR
ncbi:50S ribosomal protein L31e, partial [Candidatus Micrarchaeota archaeon]|nr:50S ribosomal protein L31e [Candidatus Micrarchaeota archaeon]